MSTVTLNVSDIRCGHCKAAIEDAVGEVPGVSAVSVDVATKTVRRQHDDVNLALVEAAIVGAGYTVGSHAGS